MPQNINTTDNEQKKKRPRIITTLSILAFLFSLFYFLKFSQAIIQWNSLTDLSLTISPLYLVIDGLVWGLSGLFLGWSLWTGKPWTIRFVLILLSAYIVVFWVDLIWIAEPEVLRTRWGFNLILTLLAPLLCWLGFNSKASREYFNRNPAKID